MNTNNIHAQLAEAVALHQQGRLGEAEPIYRKVLMVDSRNADALYLFGLLHLQLGNWEDAVRATAASIKARPGNPEALNNQGYAQQMLGQHDQALTSYGQALQLNPGYAGAWYNRGNVQQDMGRYDDAVASYRQALALRPAHADTWVNLGKALKLLGRHEEALTCYEKAIALVPDNAIAYNNLGSVLYEIGRYEPALESLNKAVSLNPQYADAYSNASMVLHEMERYDEAFGSCQEAIRIDPRHAEAYSNLGKAMQELKQFDEAMASFEKSIELMPDKADAWVGKGRLLIELGRMSEAEEVLVRAVELAAVDESAPLITLLLVRRCQRGDPLLEQLAAHYAARDRQAPEKRIALDFAMGKAMENIGDYDAAFEAYQEGNRLHLQEHAYDEAEDVRYVESTCSYFTAELFDNYLAGAESTMPVQHERVPVFIIGMPRSGTTLIEQVLASHADLFGAGELKTLGELVSKVELPPLDSPEWERSLHSLRELGQEYLDEVWKLAPDARYITDKMPHNFKHAGLIPLMLPNAKIIHSMRDPMDNCFSCYALSFKHAHEYSYDLELLGRHYQRYRKLMQHWHDVLPPGRMLDVRYEDTVADLEGQARRVLEYIGLPWDPTCLKFYENKRAVSTASVTQVRQPVYSSSVARWKRFEKHLEPLMNIIQPEN